MIRALHRWPGLLAFALATVLALSGAALSVFPAAEWLAAPAPVAGQTVADLAALSPDLVVEAAGRGSVLPWGRAALHPSGRPRA